MNIIWEAQPRQKTALERSEDEILYGGGRGGGKTDAGMASLLYNIDHPLYRALVIRKNADDLKDWMDRARLMYAGTRAEFTGNPTTIRFPRGGIIRSGHLNDENAYMKYQGHEYQKMLIEELSQIARERDYLKLIGSCRSTVPEIKPQVFATTNADDPGIEWIKIRWNIPDMPDFEKVYTNTIEMEVEGDTLVKTLAFIPAKLEDNPILMNADPSYVAYLESLKKTDPELYESWRKGNWKGFGTEGSYFRTQVLQAEKDKRITDVPYDETLDVHTWCDLGMDDSFAIGYFQVHGLQWRMINYDEFEGENLGSAIQRMRDHKYNYGRHFAPFDIEVRDLSAETQGATRKDVAKEKGVDYEIVEKLPVHDGINAARMAFSQLWIDKTKCEQFLKRIRRYHKEFDEKRGRFKSTPVHDVNSHAADMFRYWAVSKDKLTVMKEPNRAQSPSWVSNRWSKKG